jgi:transposase-like protein
VSPGSPRAGVDYPGSYADVRAWFPTDAASLDYLDWLRWPDGFLCPVCRGTKAWKLPDGRWSCGVCGRRVSATAGTIFHGTRTPLTIWFAAAWQMTSQKHGISALGLKRTLGIGSEQTAWAMLHRYRTAMVRPGRERLSGIVEIDETCLGGPEPGVRGRGAQGKVMVEVAVEQDGRALGRCRLQVIPDVAGPTLRAFMLDHVEPGSIVITDGLASYRPACGEDYTHQPEPIGPSGQQAHELLPGVHRVASLAQRWLLGTHQGGVKPGHIQAYLDEFTFRFNRRRSRARGMLFYRLLQQAVQAPPRTYRSLVVDPGAGRRTPQPPPPHKRVRPASLDGEPIDRPWRHTHLPIDTSSGDLLH